MFSLLNHGVWMDPEDSNKVHHQFCESRNVIWMRWWRSNASRPGLPRAQRIIETQEMFGDVSYHGHHGHHGHHGISMTSSYLALFDYPQSSGRQFRSFQCPILVQALKMYEVREKVLDSDRPKIPKKWSGSVRHTGWWFGTFFIFPYIGNNHPNWLSHFSEGLKPQPPTRHSKHSFRQRRVQNPGARSVFRVNDLAPKSSSSRSRYTPVTFIRA